MTRLSNRQKALLRALREHDRRQGVAAPDLVRILGSEDHSQQGIHQTGASLARKGLVVKLRHHRWVFLRISPAGIRWLDTHGVTKELPR